LSGPGVGCTMRGVPKRRGENSMTDLGSLWLPILLAAIFVHIVSAIIHMGPFWHRSDWRALPDQEAARAALGAQKIPPGDYMLPHCAPGDMRKPEALQKFTEGPIVVMSVRPNGMPSMATPMIAWLIYLLIVALFAGYVAAHALAPGAHYMNVFRYVGTTAFMALGLGGIVNSIWFSRQWSSTLKHVADGLIYALVMAGTFGWLWPK
jgi:hypothetical protein